MCKIPLNCIEVQLVWYLSFSIFDAINSHFVDCKIKQFQIFLKSIFGLFHIVHIKDVADTTKHSNLDNKNYIIEQKWNINYTLNYLNNRNRIKRRWKHFFCSLVSCSTSWYINMMKKYVESHVVFYWENKWKMYELGMNWQKCACCAQQG